MAKKRSRPSNKTLPQTVATGGHIISMALPGGKGDKFEMLSQDDLLTRRGFGIYREMRGDDQVKASLWFKKMLIIGRVWDIEPASDDAIDKKVAEFIHKNFNHCGLQNILWDMLTAFDFGFSVGEILWEIKDDEGSLKLFLKDVKYRDPQFMVIRVDEHGNITSFVQRPIEQARDIVIDPEKILHFAYQGEFGNHYGISDLRSAYRAWWSKKYITQFYNVFLERFGSPLMKTSYPRGASEKLKAALKNIMSTLSSKTDILVPEGVAIDLIEATRSGTAKYDEALTHYDIRIATAILVPALLGMGTDIKRGSDSQSRLHLRTLMKVVQFIGDQISKEIRAKIIEPLVISNFTETTKIPRLIFQDYGEFEAFEISDAIKELFNAGILDMNQEDVNYARGILGLPIRDEDDEDEVLRSQPPPLGAGPVDPNNPGAQQGNDRAKKGPSTRRTE